MLKIVLIFLIAIIPFSTTLGQVEFEEVEIGCINLGKLDKKMVFKSNNDYDELYFKLSPHPDCSSYVLPQVDFDNYTLVGFDASTGGCDQPEYSFQIEASDNGSCLLKLKVIEKGFCRILWAKVFWILVSNSECNEIKIETETQRIK